MGHMAFWICLHASVMIYVQCNSHTGFPIRKHASFMGFPKGGAHFFPPKEIPEQHKDGGMKEKSFELSTFRLLENRCLFLGIPRMYKIDRIQRDQIFFGRA